MVVTVDDELGAAARQHLLQSCGIAQPARGVGLAAQRRMMH
jgi:hypothetical protein